MDAVEAVDRIDSDFNRQEERQEVANWMKTNGDVARAAF